MVEWPSGLVGVHWNVANPAPSVTVFGGRPGGADGQHPVERARRRGGDGPGQRPPHPGKEIVERVRIGGLVVQLAHRHRRGAQLEGRVAQCVLELVEVRLEEDVVGGDVELAGAIEHVRPGNLDESVDRLSGSGAPPPRPTPGCEKRQP